MGVSKKCTIFCVFVLSVFLVGAYAGEKQEIRKSFEAYKTVKLALVSGDCAIEADDQKGIELSVVHTYDSKKYEVVVDKKEGVLILKEKFNGSGSGDSMWNLSVPRNTEIIFSSASGDGDIKGLTKGLTFKSASGDLECGNIKGNVTVSTASGDLEIKNITGDITVKTASGDIEGGNLKGKMTVKSASGDIELNGLTGSINVRTASGEIELDGLVITGDSSIKTASGEIEVKLEKGNEHNLTLVTASGDVVLDYNGNPLKGMFEFSARKSSGEIISPVKFQKKEETKHHGQKYVVKSFSIGGNSPKIILKTASGTVELKK
jgi:DUF4097 and DUF4098 domain-containing protein YvlB